MKKILVPTDFSNVSKNAFIHAIEIANKLKAEIILLHTFELPVVDNQYFPVNYNVLFESLELSNFDMFKDEVPKLRALAEERGLQHIKISHRLMDGDLVYNIKKCIKDDSIDMVVMGTSGASGWTEFFIGTNAGEVLTSVNVPVLSIPSEAEFHKIETIGFTTRYRDKDRKALKKVLKIAHKCNAKVKCLYVKTSNSDVSMDVISEWEKYFEKEPVDFSIIPVDDVKATITDFISHKNIDILAMLTYKRSFFGELFHPNLAQSFANHSSVPILALHEE